MKHLIPFFEYSSFSSDIPSEKILNSLEVIRQDLGWGLKDFDDVKYRLESDCVDFLEEIKSTKRGAEGILIYRGLRYNIEYDIPGLIDKKVRKDRTPLDMDETISNELDMAIYQKLGVSLRSEGLFTTKSYRSARNYSDIDSNPYADQRPFVIFPKGEYSYYWSEDNSDLFGSVNDEKWYEYVSMDDAFYVIKRIADERQADQNNMTGEEWSAYCDSIHDELYAGYEEFKSRISQSYTKGTDLSKIGPHEITFICDEYYAVDAVFIPYITEWLFGN